MEFSYSPEELRLRSDVQDFIRANLTDAVRAELSHAELGYPNGEHSWRFFSKVLERGWGGYAYPREYGGQGGSLTAQYIIEEEFLRIGLRIIGGGTGEPAILASGTEEQKRKYLPAAIRGEIFFALGFTEPQAGADLAGIRCRAMRSGDTYVINGQKIYTTAAHFATHIFLMVRTDPDSTRQKGLSILIVPMETPGISVRPLVTIQNEPRAPMRTTYGDPLTNEVFFDDVQVPVSCLLGEENDGWGVAQRGLNLDRIGAMRYLLSTARDEDFVNWLKSGGELAESLRNDATVRDKLAEIWTEGQVARLMTMRSLSIAARDGVFSYEGAAEKVWGPEHGVRATEAISQLIGPFGQLLNGSPLAIENGIFAHNMLGAFQSCVNHGSVQIMRDQVARRGLGMPKHPPSARKP
jgi:alkylation response protein AidB-like acyl-CoA dehydrogenase